MSHGYRVGHAAGAPRVSDQLDGQHDDAQRHQGFDNGRPHVIQPSAVAANVMLCATVKAVIVPSRGLHLTYQQRAGRTRTADDPVPVRMCSMPSVR